MARIRAVEIDNFRAIKKLMWLPSPGINCLIGPGDSGKSSILDAIDFCLGARRNIQFTDADFYRLNVGTPITISVTIGELYDELKSLEAYGLHLMSITPGPSNLLRNTHFITSRDRLSQILKGFFYF